MAIDVREYLVSQGISNEDATTFLADPKMAKAFEASARQFDEAQEMRTQTTQQKNELDKWWKDTAQPAILNADGGSASAKAEAARYKAYVMDLKDKGYPVPEEWVKEGAATVTTPIQNAAPAFDVNKFAYETADSMTMLYDLGTEYQELYNTPLPGAHALLQEAKSQNRDLRTHVRSKFNFDGKRAEKAEAKINERIQAAVKETEDKLAAKAAERANPMLAPAVTSRAAAVVEAQGDHADSWKTKQGRNEAKRDRLLQFRNVAQKTA